jgi:hypothetical protein
MVVIWGCYNRRESRPANGTLLLLLFLASKLNEPSALVKSTRNSIFGRLGVPIIPFIGFEQVD